MILTVDSKNVAYALKVVMDHIPGRIDQIKAIRSMYGLTLVEARDLVDAEYVRRNPEQAVDKTWQRLIIDRRFSNRSAA